MSFVFVEDLAHTPERVIIVRRRLSSLPRASLGKQVDSIAAIVLPVEA